MDVLGLAGVVHGYGERDVLVGVTLGVAAGECVVVVGGNGAGKSTLLRIAAGRERPAEGTAAFRGEAADENAAGFRAGVAAVLEVGACYPDLTVREHLMFVALAHGAGAEAGAVVARALAEHRLAGHGDALPSGLSSGQAQLLALAAAWVRPYALLVLDEPEQHLDTRAREELARRVNDAKRGGAAVLVATHDERLAEAVGDRAFTLDDGRLRAHVDR
ncbi:ATP-binding cassette domain-containing protein [Streptomyces sp. B6B3]|uniref:ABC transporter ATP-binding protein n=1 Tax=Streptomyces sp. B6B3 TaxID=3153570 RepID=UPI00325EC32A